MGRASVAYSACARKICSGSTDAIDAWVSAHRGFPQSVSLRTSVQANDLFNIRAVNTHPALHAHIQAWDDQGLGFRRSGVLQTVSPST